MSNIPSSAMPHAGPKNNNENNGNNSGTSQNNDQGGKKGVSARAGKIADKARDNPKTAIAAGAAVLAGAVAAVAIPMVRSRKASGNAGGTKNTAATQPRSGSSGNSTEA